MAEALRMADGFIQRIDEVRVSLSDAQKALIHEAFKAEVLATVQQDFKFDVGLGAFTLIFWFGFIYFVVWSRGWGPFFMLLGLLPSIIFVYRYLWDLRPVNWRRILR